MKLKIKGFKRGGVHPHDMKSLSRDAEIRRLPLPKQLTIALSQHIGAPANAIVALGDEVKIGQKIAEPASFVSAAIHSPVDGIVKEIVPLQLPNGIKTSAIVIDVAEEQNRPNFVEASLADLSVDEIAKRIAEGGIVGAGGATFPTHVKLKVPKGVVIDYLLINGVECEPYLNADNRLMQAKASEILKGIAAIQKVVNASQVVIGIENNKPEAIEIMQEAAEKAGFPFNVQPLRVRYPQGDEKQLIKAITGREIPSGALPSQVGCVVANVGTCFAIYEAVYLQKPFYERVISVTGQSIVNPSQFIVPIGVPFQYLIDAAGGIKEKSPVVKWVMGGPMMGFSFYDPTKTFTSKGSSGLLGLTFKEAFVGQQTACLNCGRCIKACPMGLQPTKMFKYIDNGEIQMALDLGLMDCKECGSCAFICPAKIPLVQGFKFGKMQARQLKK